MPASLFNNQPANLSLYQEGSYVRNLLAQYNDLSLKSTTPQLPENSFLNSDEACQMYADLLSERRQNIATCLKFIEDNRLILEDCHTHQQALQQANSAIEQILSQLATTEAAISALNLAELDGKQQFSQAFFESLWLPLANGNDGAIKLITMIVIFTIAGIVGFAVGAIPLGLIFTGLSTLVLAITLITDAIIAHFDVKEAEIKFAEALTSYNELDQKKSDLENEISAQKEVLRLLNEDTQLLNAVDDPLALKQEPSQITETITSVYSSGNTALMFAQTGIDTANQPRYSPTMNI